MSHRPKTLLFLSLFLWATVFMMPVQIMVLYGHAPWEFLAILTKLSFLNLMVMALSACNAIWIAQAHSHLKWSLPSLFALVAFNNWWVSEAGQDFAMWTTTLATLAFILPHGALLHPRLREVIANPGTRWWRVPERHRIRLPITLNPLRGNSFCAHTFDISPGGAFIPYTEMEPVFAAEYKNSAELDVGDRISIKLKVGTLRKIQCEARVVRKAQPAGRYPGGIGIQFSGISWSDLRHLRSHLSSSDDDLEDPERPIGSPLS